MSEVVVLDHGGGGRKSRDLVREVFQSRFDNPALNLETDSAIIGIPENAFGRRGTGETADVSFTVAVTTDAHVVKPRFFPGGDIGRLAVCGTVNDLVVSGADPRYMTAAFIVEEGFSIDELSTIAASMARAAAEAGVQVVAGDTKVVGRGECDGVFITTTGVGTVPAGREGIARAAGIAAGDVVLVNGPVGDHGAAIACARNGIQTDPPLLSDCAPLAGLVRRMYEAGVMPRFMRDATRGGLATVLCELSEMASVGIEVAEDAIPIRAAVRGVCEMYGFDPFYLANEGTMICVVAGTDEKAALEAMRAHDLGRSAAVIGTVASAAGADANGESRQPADSLIAPGSRPRAILRTSIGGTRILRMLSGEQLPRIC